MNNAHHPARKTTTRPSASTFRTDEGGAILPFCVLALTLVMSLMSFGITVAQTSGRSGHLQRAMMLAQRRILMEPSYGDTSDFETLAKADTLEVLADNAVAAQVSTLRDNGVLTVTAHETDSTPLAVFLGDRIVGVTAEIKMTL